MYNENQMNGVQEMVAGFSKFLNKKVIIGAVLTTTAFIIASKTSYTIKSSEVGILSTFAKYSEKPVAPGLHFKMPFIQEVERFSVRVHSVNYKSNGGKSNNEVYNLPYIMAKDKNTLPIAVELTVQFVPDARQAPYILQKYGWNYFDKGINPIIRDVVRNVIGKFEAEKIAFDRDLINVALNQKLPEAFKGSPFIIKQVSLRNIVLPESVTKKIKQVQEAKQEEQRLIRVEGQAKKKQDIARINAETKLIEVTTQAKAQAEKKKLQADAEAYSILQKAKAQAEANKIISGSIKGELLDYIKVKNWDGANPKVYAPGGEKPQLLMKADIID